MNGIKLDKINSNIAPASKVKFNLEFDVSDLIGDLQDLSEWSDLSGNRKTWALIPYGTTGRADPVRSKILLDKRPMVKKLFDSFPGKVKHAVYSFLAPNTIISLHSDTYKDNGDERPKFPVFNTTYRFQIPLITNNESFFYNDGAFYQMKLGELWMINNHKIHGAINNHASQDRYHIIFDVEPNAETIKLLEDCDTSLGYQDEQLEKRFGIK